VSFSKAQVGMTSEASTSTEKIKPAYCILGRKQFILLYTNLDMVFFNVVF
jgi:hypothetical protein